MFNEIIKCNLINSFSFIYFLVKYYLKVFFCYKFFLLYKEYK